MKLLLTTTFCLTLIINSFCQSNTIKNNLKAVQPLSEGYFGKDTTHIYFLDDLVLYQKTMTSYNYFSQRVAEIIDTFDSIDPITGDTVKTANVSFPPPNEDSVIITKSNTYFAHHKDSAYGYAYQPNHSYNIQRITVAQGRGFTFFNPDTLFVATKPNSSYWNYDKSELIEMYIEPPKEDCPGMTIVFYYKKDLNIPYSISDILTKDRQMTCYKMQVKFDEFFDKRNNQTVPAHTATDFELREFVPADTKEIMKYFEWYKVDVGKNK